MTGVVLSMITKDSLTKMKTSIGLAPVLDSTLQVPYRTLILVDDSKDGTAKAVGEWCERHGKELMVERSRTYGYHRATRATARQTAIDVFAERFSDEWLMFVDDDVVLRPGWWRWVEEHDVLDDERVGEVWGINWDATPERARFLGLFNVSLRDYLVRKFNERGGTHDTLYRRKAIEGVRIPPELHVYEDAYLHFHVLRGGWRSVVNPVGVVHYHPVSMLTDLKEEMGKARTAIYVAYKYGICEYENLRTVEECARHKLRAWLALARPVLGLLPMLAVTVRLYGLRTGVVEALKRQYLKLWFRLQCLRAAGR